MKFSRTAIVAAFVACLAASASAQFATSYEITRTAFGVQDAANHIYTNDYSVGLAINGVNPSDFNYGAVDAPDPDINNPGDIVYHTRVLDADFKFEEHTLGGNYLSGNYYFHLGNDGNNEQEAILLDTREFSALPTVSPLSQYDDLQNLFAGQAFSLNVPGFDPNAATNIFHTSYSLVDLDAGTTPLSGLNLGNNAFNLSIPSNTLVGDHWYALHLTYASAIKTENDGFGGATSYLNYNREVTTYFYVQSVPEPATMAALGLGALVVLRRRKK
jgi:hypothetical protein